MRSRARSVRWHHVRDQSKRKNGRGEAEVVGDGCVPESGDAGRHTVVKSGGCPWMGQAADVASSKARSEYEKAKNAYLSCHYVISLQVRDRPSKHLFRRNEQRSCTPHYRGNGMLSCTTVRPPLLTRSPFLTPAPSPFPLFLFLGPFLSFLVLGPRSPSVSSRFLDLSSAILPRTFLRLVHRTPKHLPMRHRFSFPLCPSIRPFFSPALFPFLFLSAEMVTISPCLARTPCVPPCHALSGFFPLSRFRPPSAPSCLLDFRTPVHQARVSARAGVSTRGPNASDHLAGTPHSSCPRRTITRSKISLAHMGANCNSGFLPAVTAATPSFRSILSRCTYRCPRPPTPRGLSFSSTNSPATTSPHARLSLPTDDHCLLVGPARDPFSTATRLPSSPQAVLPATFYPLQSYAGVAV